MANYLPKSLWRKKKEIAYLRCHGWGQIACRPCCLDLKHGDTKNLHFLAKEDMTILMSQPIEAR